MYNNWRDIPVPFKMRRLPKDRRGYPIPVIVMRDTDGNPHFTINDSAVVAQVIENRCCAICGRALRGQNWFIGGPLAAFSDRGAFLDPPTHEECGEYALRVCPYIAAPKYTGRVDALTLDPEKVPGHIGMMRDETMIPDRPPVFVQALTPSFRIVQRGVGISPVLVPAKPWIEARFWEEGKELGEEEGKRIAMERCEEFQKNPQILNRGAVKWRRSK